MTDADIPGPESIAPPTRTSRGGLADASASMTHRWEKPEAEVTR
jgi:hypothetical protein